MEGVTLDEQIRRFLAPIGSVDGSGYGSGSGSGYGYGYGYGYGSGYGYGDGDGYGDGYGYGSGDGDSDGSGSGYGYGSGDGSGYGDGYGSGYGDSDGYGDGSGGGSWKAINGQRIYYIDDTPTVIESVHGNYARGFIVGKDLQLRPCFIARVGNCYAHGDTLRQARSDAEEKWMEDRPLEERIADFVATHPELDEPYDDLFKWHHILTGSCEAGRKEWCRIHGFLPSDAITVRSFIELTRDDYGRDAILELAKQYGLK